MFVVLQKISAYTLEGDICLHRILFPKSNLKGVWVFDFTGGFKRAVFDGLVFAEAP